MHSFNYGKQIEHLFQSVAQKNGWDVVHASKQDDMYRHIDYVMKKDNRTLTVDVKSQKREARFMEIQDEWHAIEFVGVVYPATKTVHFSRTPFNVCIPNFSLGSGRPGWLYGDADMIAFELQSRFILVDRLSLMNHCAESVKFKPLVHRSQDAKYHAYSRHGRGDLIAYINKKDLYHLAEEKWYKPIVLN